MATVERVGDVTALSLPLLFGADVPEVLSRCKLKNQRLRECSVWQPSAQKRNWLLQRA